MSAGSSVSALLLISLKATRDEIDQVFRVVAHSHASLPTTTTRALISTLHTTKLHCRMQQNWPSSFIEQRLYLAPSCWVKVNEEEEEEEEEEENIRLEEEGNKRCPHNRRKYVQKCQRSQRIEDVGRQVCQVI